MSDTNRLEPYLGTQLVGRDGEKIGRIDELYVDDRTGRPAWALVNTGLFGSSSSFVPLAQARPHERHLEVPFDKATVKKAPRLDAGGHLSAEQERELYRYYGLDYDRATSPRATGAGTDEGDVTQRLDTTEGLDADATRRLDTAGAGTPAVPADAHDADDAVTLSEERVSVETHRQPALRARLRKYVVTEEITVRVPVTREEVRVEYEPVEGAAGEGSGHLAEGEDVGEVTLHQEVPVIDRQRIPVERVRLDTETVTEEQDVTAQVRREEIDVDRDDRRDRP